MSKARFSDSNKVVKIAELNKKYFQAVLFNGILLVIIFLLLPDRTHEKLFYFCVFFIFLLIAIRIELIKLLIIKKMDSFLKGKAESFYPEDYLSLVGVTYKRSRNKETMLKIIITISIVIFFKFAGNTPQYRFYLTWTYSFIALSIVLFFTSQNIYKYFQRLIDFQNILKKNVQKSLDIQRYIKRLKILQFISLFFLLILMLLMFFEYYSVIVYLPVFLIFILGIIILDLNKVIKIGVSIIDVLL